MDIARNQAQLVVVGGGMVAHRLVEAVRARDEQGAWQVTVLAEEPRAPYDRVALTSYFSGRDPESLSLGAPQLWDDPLVTLVRGTTVTALDRDARMGRTDDGREHRYDQLVLATGSRAAVPAIPGADLPGVFVYRTLDDVAALRGWVEEECAPPRRGGGGAGVGGGRGGPAAPRRGGGGARAPGGGGPAARAGPPPPPPPPAPPPRGGGGPPPPPPRCDP